MSRGNLVTLLAALAAFAVTAAQAQEKFHVQIPAVLDPRAAPGSEEARRECSVDMLVGNYVLQKVGGSFPGATRTDGKEDTGALKVLKLTILSAHAEGRSVLGGPKSITIRAEVLQHAKVVNTTILRRQAYGGALGTVGMVGTCQIMEGIAIGLGEDVARWLPVAVVPTTRGTTSR